MRFPTLSSFKRYLPLFIVLTVPACGGGSGSSGVSASVDVVPAGGTVIPAAPATPVPTSTPTSTVTTAGIDVSVLSPTLQGLSAITSGIDINKYLVPSWNTGAVATTAAPDTAGAFRFLCAPSHNAYDDPIVYPGQPGKSHLHTFFGNTKADAYSTYTSLRNSGDSTCNTLLNRSAYWVPAMMNGRGKVVMPDFVGIYYKRLPATSPQCQTQGKACISLPRGLRYIFGYNMSAPSHSSPDHTRWWNCDAPNSGGHFANIAQAAKNCPVGARLGGVLEAPNCWNGTDLDTADHRSHMAYPSYGEDGQLRCPATHPYIIPTFTIAAWYTVDETIDRSGDESPNANTWYLSSDRMPGMANAVPGTTFHSDWFGAWEDSVLDMWTANCINKLLSCSGGDLGNGKQMAMTHGYENNNKTTLVDILPKL